MRALTHLSDDRRSVLLATIALAGLAALVVAWFAVNGQGDRQVAATDTEVIAQADEDADEDAAATGDVVGVAITYEAFLSRDPFESIRPEAPEPPADPINDDPNDDPSNGEADDPSNGEAVNGELMIEVIEVSETGARIRIGSTVYAPNVGDVFGDDLRLVRIIGDCVELQQGDVLLPILCAGEATAK